MSIGSLMLKLNREIERVNTYAFSVRSLIPLLVVISFLFMEEDDGPLFMESG